ncbi:MAG TPA: dTMP kinase [Streptosporangiaceae bacterium]|nr:dTMP kinase [Streptosporangiaceae bacterium]
MNLRSPSRAGRSRNGVLSIRPFRRLWIATSLSSLGDWLSLVALAALASALAGPGAAAQYSAVGGVWLSSLLPALVLGPLAGAVADRMDRRLNMIIGDVLRAALYLSIPLDLSLHFVNELTWVYLVQFVASCVSLFWTPAKDASIPNLVPRDKLEEANQYSLFTTFGTAPIAGLVFSLLSLVSRALGNISHYFTTNPVNLALYFNAVTFVVSAVTIYALREIPKRQFSAHISAPSVAKTIWEGWKFIGQTEVVRGLVIGMVGAFAAGGVVVGLGQPYIKHTLHGGDAGWGVVFAAIFVGLAGGMFLGMRILRGFSRRRLFGLSIAASAIPLALIALVPNLVVVVVLVVLLGACAGVAYVTGYTIVGREVDDDTRGRTFAFLYSAIRVILFAVIAVAPFVAAGFTALVRGVSGTGNLHIAHVSYQGIGYNLVMLLAAAIALWVGWLSYRHMDDRRGVPLREDLMSVVRGEDFQPVPGHVNGNGRGPEPPVARRGVFIALEGGEGAGKTTQARLLAIWLRDQGYDVETTREPGATKIGMRLRAILLDTAHTGLSARAETLLYAADRAEHVATVICPALQRGAVVVTDRFVDSSLAYQGAGRNLPVSEVARLNRWATGGLVPDLTILLDMPPAAGLGRRARSADRLEAEPLDFHERVRAGFLSLAQAEPDRYLVLNAARPPAELSWQIQDRIRDMLPDPVPPMAEANTGSIPAIVD